MPAGDYSNARSKINLVMAGVEAGVLGGLFMMAWLATLSLLQGRSIWSMPNLLASTFYGEAALRRGFRWTSLSGVALHVIVSAMAGLLFGLAVGGIVNRGRVMLLAHVGLGVFLGSFPRYLDALETNGGAGDSPAS